MKLPLARNTTYAPRRPVKSADLNDIQDSVVKGSHGLVPKRFGFYGGYRRGCAMDGAGIVVSEVVGGLASVQLVIATGEVLTGMSFRGMRTGAVGPITLQLHYVDENGINQDGPWFSSTPGTTWTSVSHDVSPHYVFLPEFTYSARITMAQPGMRCSGFALTTFVQ